MRTLLRNGRIIFNVPEPWLRPEAKALKAQLDPLVPPWCLDFGWRPGCCEDDAYAAIQPGWRFLDIRSFFTSIDQWRLFGLLPRELRNELRAFFRGCSYGVPEGCSFSPTLANIYLSAIDKRWQGRCVRYGDNIAVDDRDRYADELLTIGLYAERRNTFTSRSGSGQQAGPRRPAEERSR